MAHPPVDSPPPFPPRWPVAVAILVMLAAGVACWIALLLLLRAPPTLITLLLAAAALWFGVVTPVAALATWGNMRRHARLAAAYRARRRP